MKISKDYIKIVYGTHPAVLPYIMKKYGGRCYYKILHDYLVGETRRGEAVLWYADTDFQPWGGRCIQFTETGGVVSIKSISETLGMASHVDAKPCLFGLHLMDCYDAVFIFPDEATAMIASLKIDNASCMAVGGNELTLDLLMPLQGKRIVMFPNWECMGQWRKCFSGIRGVSINGRFASGALQDDVEEYLNTLPMLPYRELRTEKTPSEWMERYDIEKLAGDKAAMMEAARHTGGLEA